MILHGNKVLAFETPFCNELDTYEELDLLKFQIKNNTYAITNYLENLK